MIVARDLGHVVAKRATHHHPHQEFSTLSTSLFDQFMPGDFGQNLRIVNDVI